MFPPATHLITTHYQTMMGPRDPRADSACGEPGNEEGELVLPVEISSGIGLTASSGNTGRKFWSDQGGRPSIQQRSQQILGLREMPALRM